MRVPAGVGCYLVDIIFSKRILLGYITSFIDDQNKEKISLNNYFNSLIGIFQVSNYYLLVTPNT